MGFLIILILCFNLRVFIQEEKLCLKCLIAVPAVTANVKRRAKLLMVSNSRNCVVSEMEN